MKAADVEAYAKLGAMLGGGSDRQVDALGRFGRRLWEMVIIRDDLEDLLSYKVELKSRVENESLPLPVYYALKSRKYGSEVRRLLSKSSLSVDELKELVKLVERSRGIEKTIKVLKKFRNEAEEALNEVEREVKGLKILLKAAVPLPRK